MRRLLPGVWAGLLLGVGAIAAPAAFAVLAPVDAGRLVGRLFATEAYTSLAVAIVFTLLERRHAGARFTAELLFALGALFCVVAGYFALQPMMESARDGQGALSFGQLHAISVAFYAVKTACVVALAWRLTTRNRPSSSGSSADSSRA